MGTSNISSVGKLFAARQVADVNGSVQEEDIKIAFTDIMGQMASLTGNDLLAGNQMFDRGKNPVAVENTVSDKAFDRYQHREMQIKETSGKDWDENGQFSEKMDAFADEVKEVLEEELGVSEEQITKAMEMLGLTFADLMNPNQLAALVAELTECKDVSALLCNSEFLEVLKSVGEVTDNLLKELGISAEELSQRLELAQDKAVIDIDAADEPVKVTEGDADVEDTIALEENPTVWVAEKSQDEKTVPDEEKQKEILNDPRENEEQMKVTAPSEKENPATDNGQASKNDGSQTNHGEAAVLNQNMTETVYVENAEGANSFSSQLDVSNIIRQIVEFSKVTLTNTATTMEMQLTPEHLGKIYLEITSKEGVVSARITAQNEVVKEALESQIAELRQNMNQAGIKVEAVEVTVGSHEFERNLEENAKREEKQAEEQEKAQKQTRRINLNELDEWNGLMTEEESLVAQMMADQGNSIDFTA